MPQAAAMTHQAQVLPTELLSQSWLRHGLVKVAIGGTCHWQRLAISHVPAAAGANRHHWGAELEDSWAATAAQPWRRPRTSDDEQRRMWCRGRRKLLAYTDRCTDSIWGPMIQSLVHPIRVGCAASDACRSRQTVRQP